MTDYITQARRLRPLIEAAAQSLDDENASLAVELHQKMDYKGALIAVGTRINWRGALKRAVSDMWDTISNDPEHAPTLWEDVCYRMGYRIIPETITPGAEFSEGEIGWWSDELYKSKLNSNVWTPEQHPAGWELVDADN